MSLDLQHYMLVPVWFGAGLWKWIWLGPRVKHHRILTTGIKYLPFFIDPSVAFENSLTMPGNESLHVQVQSRSQGLLVAMIKARWNVACKIILWKSIFMLHFVYFSVGIKMHNLDVSVYLHRLWMLLEMQKALRYLLQGQWISRSWLLSY